jgi:hypothetical protein
MKRILKLKNLLRNQKDKYIRNFSVQIESKIKRRDTEKILEFFQKNFKGNKKELVSTFGKDFPFFEIKETTKEIYEIVKDRNEMKIRNPRELNDKSSVTIPYIGYLPGSGKSKYAKELMSVLQKIDKKEMNVINNGIQILISYGKDKEMIEPEKIFNIRIDFIIRLLLGYFGFGNFNFSDAVEFINKNIDLEYMIIENAMDIILEDLKDIKDPYFVISIDDFNYVIFF